MIMEYAQENPDIQKKVTVVLRKPDEILTSRGGDAPNRTQVSIEKNISCVHPFQQLIVRPDGKVSLCCNDPLGKSTMGDVNVNSLVDIWYGEKYESVRQAIFNGRENFEHCKNCDVFVLD
jgi:radical SAM protein with 4Fe4S-binding SPASM domain